MTAAVVAGAGALLMLSGVPAHAGTGRSGPPPLIGDVTVFNDEIVEPVSAPVSTCGGVSLLAQAPAVCKDTSRVSDDDS
ncbi:hypothetical protein MF672_023990 [Actinomadura sp. ATCC 31491]|uniref:DUF320 domain-containing protein n=1 Tax=Actinomadura luzonensis TaxID=2805427 RepID=A0ABT0FWU9_9ACTN|nr:hypothetical protein [Actinomadura luzonensis]MCK2216831.1 hypothetical protein [Actinomadura luzonensis]